MVQVALSVAVLMLAQLAVANGQVPRLCRASSHFCFTYNPELVNGPLGWSYLEGCNCCSGSFQSPIDIPLSVVQRSCGHFLQVGYQSDVTITGPLLNNGLYPKFNPRLSDSPPTLMGVPQNSSLPYIFANLHLHVGRQGRPGSEHSVNGIGFDGEIHLVHYASGLTGLPEASGVSAGITVVAIFLSTQYGEPNLELNNLLRNVPMIEGYQGPGCTPHFRTTPNDFEAFSFRANRACNYHDDDSNCGRPVSCSVRPARLLPSSGLFYTYQGSLTTPPCSEAVNWIIMRDPLLVSPQQLKNLQSMQIINDEYATLSTFSNTRQQQPLNGRMVHANFCPIF